MCFFSENGERVPKHRLISARSTSLQIHGSLLHALHVPLHSNTLWCPLWRALMGEWSLLVMVLWGDMSITSLHHLPLYHRSGPITQAGQ